MVGKENGIFFILRQALVNLFFFDREYRRGGGGRGGGGGGKTPIWSEANPLAAAHSRVRL